MFFHRKELIQPVKVGKPDARFGTFLLEQFGGATGELTAALQYWVQSFHVENAGIRDMLQDIAIEEFSHLEMVGKLIAQHTSKIDQTAVYDAPLFKLKGGGPHFLDSQGSCWTAAYIQEGGNVVRDLRANISAEAGARQTYEALIKACDDEGTKKTLHPSADARDHPRQHVHEGARRDGQAGRSDVRQHPARTIPSSWCSTCRRARTCAGRGTRSPTSNISPIPKPKGGMPPPPVNPDDERPAPAKVKAKAG